VIGVVINACKAAGYAAVAVLLVTGCDSRSSAPPGASTTIAPRNVPRAQSDRPYVIRDPARFPKMASHLAFSFGDGSTNSHFALNVIRGCNPEVADRSIALNPKQVNFIVPGVESSAAVNRCGAEDGLAVTYGNGYRRDSSVIHSPYRGVGTIRPFDAGEDIARYRDGTRAFSDDVWVLNLFSSGSDRSTAEWAARLKAHWTLTNLGGGLAKHPGVQGVWGDNFLWWNRNFDSARSPGGSPLGGDAARWDDGLIRNHQKLRALLGPDFLLGGNGAGWACSGYTPYYGTNRDDACTAADAAMWEDAGRYIYDEGGWDRYIRYFTGWIASGRSERRQKYGIMAEYGTCGFGNLGHSLTDSDLRMGLAMATIGGIDLWAVHDCDWGTTVVPGEQFSIPEMGDTNTFPRGWLGQPTSDATRVDLGRWMRPFTGGRVYANVTDEKWSVDGISVPPRNAVFVKR
jgi:hypothetical protein